MRCIGKTSVCSSIPAVSAALLLASAAIMLLPTKAAAQFNIDGIIRGAISHGGYGYGYRAPSHHSAHHESGDKSKDSGDDAADSKSGKGIKSTSDTNTANAGGSTGAPGAASDTPPPAKGGPSGGASGGPAGGSPGGASKPSVSDVPTFAPSR